MLMLVKFCHPCDMPFFGTQLITQCNEIGSFYEQHCNWFLCRELLFCSKCIYIVCMSVQGYGWTKCENHFYISIFHLRCVHYAYLLILHKWFPLGISSTSKAMYLSPTYLKVWQRDLIYLSMDSLATGLSYVKFCFPSMDSLHTINTQQQTNIETPLVYLIQEDNKNIDAMWVWRPKCCAILWKWYWWPIMPNHWSFDPTKHNNQPYLIGQLQPIMTIISMDCVRKTFFMMWFKSQAMLGVHLEVQNIQQATN